MTVRSLTLSRPALGTAIPFAVPIGLSAFLLFSVEPLVGRLTLPVFGGTPAVWATTLFFFQAVLLAGYLYSHLSVTRFGRWGPPVHLAIAGLGLLALVTAPGRVADLRIGSLPPVLDVLWILVAVIGLPAFVLTTTTPLISGWMHAARADAQTGTDPGDPYWLYALSNGGSLLALLAYPLLIEPRLGLTTQRGVWAFGYAVLIGLLALAASRVLPLLWSRAGAFAATATTTIADVRSPSIPIDWPRRSRWLLLAAVPSGLLTAVTTFIASDLVSAPLLWVAPLAIYLASFIVAFSPRGGHAIRVAVIAAPAMITLLWVPYGSAGGWPITLILPLELVAFAVVALALHGRLAQDHPDAAHVTEYYLILAVGGALASAFVAILAPIVFPGVWEYPILLVAALVALALVTPAPVIVRDAARRLDFRPFVGGFRGRMLPYLVASAILILGLVATGSLAAEAGLRWLLVGGLILAVGARPWFLAIATAFVLALATFVLQPPAEFRERSFFGVTEVLRPVDGELTILMNGTTVHGTQSTDPARRLIPLSYYSTHGPAGDIFRVAAAESPGSEVGVAGLGGGALATYERPGTTMTFFEIDPVVVKVASDPRFFTYLTDAPTMPRIVLGDARLSLQAEPDRRYDLLVLDAFSSDSVPVHLLTVEAIADEVRTVTPKGVVAFHISNRYYDLAPPIAAAVSRDGLTVVERSYDPKASGEPGGTPSRWLAASRDPSKIAALLAAGWTSVEPADHPFTDDYADLLHYLSIGR